MGFDYISFLMFILMSDWFFCNVKTILSCRESGIEHGSFLAHRFPSLLSLQSIPFRVFLHSHKILVCTFSLFTPEPCSDKFRFYYQKFCILKVGVVPPRREFLLSTYEILEE